MIQTYILRDDIDPLSAIASADDYSICGNCRHRKQADGSRSCYVNIGQSVMSVWRAYQAGRYKELWTNEELEHVVPAVALDGARMVTLLASLTN